jgi:hypothetical protein
MFAVLHQIAVQRGEGLRPELLKLLQRSAIEAEINQAIDAALCGSDCISMPSPASVTPDETK